MCPPYLLVGWWLELNIDCGKIPVDRLIDCWDITSGVTLMETSNWMWAKLLTKSSYGWLSPFECPRPLQLSFLVLPSPFNLKDLKGRGGELIVSIFIDWLINTAYVEQFSLFETKAWWVLSITMLREMWRDKGRRQMSRISRKKVLGSGSVQAELSFFPPWSTNGYRSCLGKVKHWLVYRMAYTSRRLV